MGSGILYIPTYNPCYIDLFLGHVGGLGMSLIPCTQIMQVYMCSFT